jgi:hypothetical protein
MGGSAMKMTARVIAIAFITVGVLIWTGADALDLAVAPADVTVIGAESNNALGSSAASGDFNGDGSDDLLLGAPFADSLTGKAYVIFGAPSLMGTRDLASAAFNLAILGADSGDLLGQSVASGDFNGDGIDDIAVGAPGADGTLNSRSGAGEAFVIYGSTTLAGVRDMALNEHNLRVIGVGAGDALGTSVAAGNFNADSRDDIALGAPVAGGGTGEAYVIYGDASWQVSDLAFGGHNLRVIGAGAGGALGASLAAGNFNADARDDIALGAPGVNADTGEAYVIYGDANWGVSAIGLGEHNLKVIGAEAGDRLGQTLAAGNFNADARDDVVLGAREADGTLNNRPQAGEVYVIYGDANWGVSAIGLGEHNLKVIGADAGDELGSSLAAGNFNADARDDLVLAAPYADGPSNTRFEAGEAYVIYGDANWGVSDMALGEHNFNVVGVQDNDQLGFGVAAGNFNADARDDILLGAFGGDGPSNNRSLAGEAYLFYGAMPPTQGDANCDGIVNAVDALHVLRFSAGIGQISCVGRGDVNCDENRTAVDALGILRHSAGLSQIPQTEPCSDIGNPL